MAKKTVSRQPVPVGNFKMGLSCREPPPEDTLSPGQRSFRQAAEWREPRFKAQWFGLVISKQDALKYIYFGAVSVRFCKE